MTGKSTNSGNNRTDVMDDDAELRLNPDTLCPENSVEGVLGRPGGHRLAFSVVGVKNMANPEGAKAREPYQNLDGGRALPGVN